jgi:hypothetical protein
MESKKSPEDNRENKGTILSEETKTILGKIEDSRSNLEQTLKENTQSCSSNAQEKKNLELMINAFCELCGEPDDVKEFYRDSYEKNSVIYAEYKSASVALSTGRSGLTLITFVNGSKKEFNELIAKIKERGIYFGINKIGEKLPATNKQARKNFQNAVAFLQEMCTPIEFTHNNIENFVNGSSSSIRVRYKNATILFIAPCADIDNPNNRNKKESRPFLNLYYDNKNNHKDYYELASLFLINGIMIEVA